MLFVDHIANHNRVRFTFMGHLQRIRQQILDGEYYVSAHAEEEMADDAFDLADVEHADLHGFFEKRLTHDPRGTRFRIEGPALNGRVMRVICRYVDVQGVIIITVYAVILGV